MSTDHAHAELLPENQQEIQRPPVFAHFMDDALAGIITGVMAVPLSVGIALMSDYPVYLGLYTVIFAGFVSFFMYLFRVGNFTGMPGIAAGLAPALAFGVATFGMQNMPFLILLTASIQALVWFKGWEKYILKYVPHYLVEALLAGVGIKIASKFVSKVIMSEPVQWAIVISFSALFVFGYSKLKAKFPAVPYIALLAAGYIAVMFVPFETLTLQEVPFQLALPLPHLEGAGSHQALVLAEMILFAIMLASIDVIEQVMSNVAIEEIDPLKRKTNSNNSLLAIWVINLGSTLFGGMTNLDGLAKSTTNTIAGAKTKLSNVFTSIVVLLVVMFPVVMTQTPMFVLAIIMIFSGWNMIKKIDHVRQTGRFEFLVGSACMMLVYALGIFEGLLIALAIHYLALNFTQKKVEKAQAVSKH